MIQYAWGYAIGKLLGASDNKHEIDLHEVDIDRLVGIVGAAREAQQFSRYDYTEGKKIREKMVERYIATHGSLTKEQEEAFEVIRDLTANKLMDKHQALKLLKAIYKID
jgi:hypothetical protein